MNIIRAASVQFQHAPSSKSANLEKIRDFVIKAAANRMDLIVFPEMCTTGYWHIRKLAHLVVGELLLAARSLLCESITTPR